MNENVLYQEFTVGDPSSGPFYGDKHKSKGLGMIVGVVASVVTVGAAAPLLASTTIASQIAGGAMMAGGVLSGVGAVTGNKKLMKVGGVLALAGGLGNMAASGLEIGQTAGSGSQAVSEFGTKFMESANNIGVGDLYKASTISDAKEAASSAFGAGGDVASEVAADASSTGIKLSGDTAAAGGVRDSATASGDQTLDLAKGTGGESATDTMNGGTGILNRSAPGSAVTQPKLGGSAIIDASAKAADKGPLDKILSFTKEQPALTKIGAGVLENAMSASNNDAQVNALIDKYKAEVNLLTTQNDVAKYKLNNAGKQVAMISADDPNIDAKVKQAAAGNIPVAFIPTIGQNYTPVSKNFTPVVRNATYSQPTA